MADDKEVKDYVAALREIAECKTETCEAYKEVIIGLLDLFDLVISDYNALIDKATEAVEGYSVASTLASKLALLCRSVFMSPTTDRENRMALLNDIGENILELEEAVNRLKEELTSYSDKLPSFSDELCS